MNYIEKNGGMTNILHHSKMNNTMGCLCEEINASWYYNSLSVGFRINS